MSPPDRQAKRELASDGESPPMICGHCEGVQIGFASVNDVPLCHPDEGPDCYRLVTVYQHPVPCANCPGEVGALTTMDWFLPANIIRPPWSEKIETGSADDARVGINP